MNRAEAIKMTLQIVSECEAHGTENGGGCRECPFGCGCNCLVSAGNDIPSTWLINKKIYEWTDKE